jgi:hypothetical protein
VEGFFYYRGREGFSQRVGGVNEAEFVLEDVTSRAMRVAMAI